MTWCDLYMLCYCVLSLPQSQSCWFHAQQREKLTLFEPENFFSALRSEPRTRGSYYSALPLCHGVNFWIEQDIQMKKCCEMVLFELISCDMIYLSGLREFNSEIIWYFGRRLFGSSPQGRDLTCIERTIPLWLQFPLLWML